MNHNRNTAWDQYEAGKAYKKRLGLYETVRRNERFYRGDQWQTSEKQPLPKPVFNIIRRVMDYQISSVGAADLSIRFTSGAMPYASDEEQKELFRRALEVLDGHVAYRWEACGMNAKLSRLLTDAALTGDGVLYSYWDPTLRTPDVYEGDVATEIIDSVNLFVAEHPRRYPIPGIYHPLRPCHGSIPSSRGRAGGCSRGRESTHCSRWRYGCGCRRICSLRAG